MRKYEKYEKIVDKIERKGKYKPNWFENQSFIYHYDFELED